MAELWEIPPSKESPRPSSWSVLPLCGSRAGDRLAFAKISDSSKLPLSHCPHRQMHPLRLYIFPRHRLNYLQVQNEEQGGCSTLQQLKKKKSPATVQPVENHRTTES